ncbi:MAG TPA: hypothetical protein VFH80_22325 [Solirubrobacteraceae bacterium]|nr:hypothetical protein [Solirubrobacteraceae bacterium]
MNGEVNRRPDESNVANGVDVSGSELVESVSQLISVCLRFMRSSSEPAPFNDFQ